jgi:ferrous iron transport protein B
MNGLKLAVNKTLANRHNASNDALPLPVADALIEDIQSQFGEAEPYRCLLWLMEHDRMKMFSKAQREAFDHLTGKRNFSAQVLQESQETVKRYELLTEVVGRRVINLNRRWDVTPVKTLTDRLDKVFLHPVGGYLFFLAILFVMFQAGFAIGDTLRWMRLMVG